MIRRLGALVPMIGLAALAACTTPSAGPPTIVSPPSSPSPAKLPTAGLERVMGQDARALQLLFGDPDLDLRETGARKLQFSGPLCVLDTYLYPRGSGREPVVTYVDARRPDGTDFDRASCVAALSRRQEAR
ncbi:hypothetical protein CLG96_01415 [Sphingomonas oleivorans]|uniref:Uncharacterized protein n=1 Tax=Sphingomonas oleivorans TaxID=1735121 RepID=A0A2T5G110_9SPHN|nr:hypothetical protein [Sphingomonas oleivorans]PTQ12834.1 hypothetical protein CLG96_01415 [Sphingomonas oleivorans]